MDAQPELIHQKAAVAKRKMRNTETAAVAAAPVENAGAPASEAAAVFAMIERLAMQSDIPTERIDYFVNLYQRMQTNRARQTYYAAFAAMQRELPVVSRRGGIKDRNGNIMSRYALWEDVVDAIMPVLAAHDMALSFRIRNADGKMTVTGILAHKDGHTEETTIELPYDTTGAKNAVQAIGSSASYGKRYTAFALLNLAAKGEDDDGQAAMGEEDGPISEDQLAELIALADEVGADKARFCRFLGVASLADLRVSQFDRAKAALNAKKAHAAKNT